MCLSSSASSLRHHCGALFRVGLFFDLFYRIGLLEQIHAFVGEEKGFGIFEAGVDQLLSDRRGADFPGGGVHWCVTKEAARVLIFKNTLYR